MTTKEKAISQFNNMLYPYRQIAVNGQIVDEINGCIRAKERAKKAYKRETKYLNDRIKMLEKDLRDSH